MNITLIAIIAAVVVAIVAYSIYHKRQFAKSTAAYRADVQAHPENYFVYEGGTKPNPPGYNPEE